MFSKKRIFIGITGTLIVVLIAGFLFVRHLITRSFPDYEASYTSTQISQPISIYRDEYGVPRIEAATEDDAYFAVGVAHAQDRLWQMEITRRAGLGQLAEILGRDVLDIDKLFRTLGFENIINETLEEIPDEFKNILERYAAGVNYVIESTKGKYPVEFDILQYEPEPWEPAHSLIIGKLMAWELNLSWRTNIALGQVVEQVDFELAIEAIPGYPPDAPLTIPEELRDRRFTEAMREIRKIDSKYRTLAGIQGTHIGSNSWVVSGKHTASGKPMLANDPHLGLAAPSRWYELSMHAGNDLTVGGMTLPGAPVVVIGRNNAIAWGLTNVMADDADFYLEDIDTSATPRYRLDNEWIDLQLRQEEIFIKDESPVTLNIYSTHRGPLVQSVLGVEPGKWEDQPVSMRWTGFEVTNELEALYGVNKATTYQQFRESLRNFSAPGQNFIYADTAGNIGYFAAARLPVRPHGNPILPFAGWDSQYDWTGYVPFDELPELYNPPNGIIANANNKIIDDTYPHYIGSLWEHPSRIQRILEMLEDNQTFLVSDFQRMQNDYISHHARDIVPYILQAYEDITIDDDDISRTLSYFRNWDFYFGAEDVPTAIFNVFWMKMITNTFEPRMGEALFTEYISLGNIPTRALSELLTTPDSEWFENPATRRRENRDEVIRKSLDDALQYLREKLGDDMRTWRWGAIHTVTFEHIFGNHSPIDRVVNIGPFPVGGSATTVNKGEYFLFDPYETIVGASMRFIVDMDDPAIAYTVIPTGQSGQPLHRHYKDQTQLWLDGRYKTTSLFQEPGLEYKRMHILPE